MKKTIITVIVSAFIVYVLIAFIILVVNEFNKQKTEELPTFNTSVQVDDHVPTGLADFYTSRRIHVTHHR